MGQSRPRHTRTQLMRCNNAVLHNEAVFTTQDAQWCLNTSVQYAKMQSQRSKNANTNLRVNLTY